MAGPDRDPLWEDLSPAWITTSGRLGLRPLDNQAKALFGHS